MAGKFWKQNGLIALSGLFTKKDPAQTATAGLAPVITYLQEIATASGGALVVEALPKDNPRAVSLKTADAEAFPQSSEYAHTRGDEPVVESNSFTVHTQIKQGECVLVATSHDHSRLRTAEPAHGQIDERIPDLEIYAGNICPPALKEKVQSFANRILPEQDFQKIYPAQQTQKSTPEKVTP